MILYIGLHAQKLLFTGLNAQNLWMDGWNGMDGPLNAPPRRAPLYGANNAIWYGGSTAGSYLRGSGRDLSQTTG